MKWLLLSLLSVGTSASLPSYELLYFSSAKQRNIDSILTETKKIRADLELFKCNTPNREQLFNDITAINPKANSFKIIGKNKEIYIFKNDKIFTLKGKRIRRPKDSFLKLAFSALTEINQFPIGLELIEKIQTAKTSFYLQRGRNSYNPAMPGERTYWHGNEASFVSGMDELKPQVDRLPFKLIGFSGRINWNPTLRSKLIEEDYVKREVSPVIALAHEMMHAYDGLRGLLDRRFVHGVDFEMTTVAEYRAVYLENKLRAQMGKLYRRYYGTPLEDRSKQDMLDDDDTPLMMPTPCIKWL